MAHIEPFEQRNSVIYTVISIHKQTPTVCKQFLILVIFSRVMNVREEFEYTGGMQSFTAEAEGNYTLEVWGARGEPTTEVRDNAANGGYAIGEVHLLPGDVLYLCVGGRNGYNGGGSGGWDAFGRRGGNGGGATHIASESGLLRTLSASRDSIYIVAGGGGGSGGSNSWAGSGGGSTGGTGESPWPGGEGVSPGGTQTSGGRTSLPGTGGGFGYGGNGYSYRDGDYKFNMNGGGGGGWYGGSGGDVTRIAYGSGGGGGSGYIGGVENGVMSSGICNGNGHAVISCIVNINGGEAFGCTTAFYPEGILYRNLRVSVHDDCIYPEGDEQDADDQRREGDEQGDGYCIVKEPAVRYYGTSGQAVYSPDTASPDAIEKAGIVYDRTSGTVSVWWLCPEDNGRIYRYMARAYRTSDILASADRYVQTGEEELCLTTGVYGYYYLIDENMHPDPEYVRAFPSPVASFKGEDG